MRMAATPDDPLAGKVEAMPSALDLFDKEPESPEIAALTKARKFDIDKALGNIREFEAVQKDLTGLQNSIEHLQGYKDKLDTDSIPLNQLEFVSRANQILAEVKKLQGYSTKKHLGRIKMLTTIPIIHRVHELEGAPDPAAKNTIYENVKRDIIAVLDAIIAEFEAQKAPLELQMKDMLINELELAIAEEEKVWKTDPTLPATVTTESYNSTLEAIEQWKTEIAKLRADPALAKPSEVAELIKRFWELFTSRRTEVIKIGAEKIDFNNIGSRIDALENKLDAADTIKIFDAIEVEARKLLHELDAADAALEEQAGKDQSENFTNFYKGAKKDIAELREKLQDAANLRESSRAFIEDSDMLFKSHPPHDTAAIPKGLKNQLEFIKGIKDPSDACARQKLYAHYLEQAVGHAERLVNPKVFGEFLDKDLRDQRKVIHDFTAQFSEKHGKNVKKEIYWVSWYDLTRGWEICKNWATNRIQRNSDMCIGKVGEKLVPNLNLPLTGTLGSEFSNKVHETEHHEVDRLAGLLKPHDNFHIRHMLHTETKNVDQLKAIFNVLSERGVMRWDDPILLKLLNQFQKRVIFDTENPEKEFRDESRFYLRLKEATTAIWDPDVFRNWMSQGSSAYESGKKKFESECNKRAEQPGGIRKFLSKFLKEVRMKGPYEQRVDPHEYEEMIHYCIDKGKMTPEDRIYFLIQGMATGLLSRTRGSELDSQSINHYPCIEMFAQAEGLTFQDVLELARIDADSFEPGPAYKYHFEKEIMHMNSVRERLEKAVSQGLNIDHDDFVRYGAHLTDQTLNNLLQQKTSGFQLPATGVANCTTGFLNYMDMMAHGYDTVKDKEKELARFASIVLNFDSITRGRKYADRPNQYFRWGSSGIDQKPPRASGSYMRSGADKLTTRKRVDVVKSGIREIDPYFFNFIDSPTIPTPEQVRKFVYNLKNQYPGQAIFGDKQDPKDFDSLLDVAGEYFQFVITHNRDKVAAMFEKIRKDQVKSDYGLSEKDKINAKFLTDMDKAKYRRESEKKRQHEEFEHLTASVEGEHGHAAEPHPHAKDKRDKDPWDDEPYMHQAAHH